MAILFKCKMCGGNLELSSEQKVGTCTYCGSAQTLPRIDDERRATLYDRANHYRRSGDFDKAAGIYETILNEDATDAEAYWSLTLCRYGIEYVEDPQTHHRLPTCNRTSYTSILQDADYLQALEHADPAARSLYEQEAAAIDVIQKGILAISAGEQPYDVFICYKETGADGQRTHDSVLAQDIYHQLTNDGYRVFFSRITLEGKLGEQYEPYIFAALNSAKVMLVVGTSAEHLGAVWVKNEWSRFQTLAQNDRSKLLIPCYRNMDVYDLPQELAMLQSQDMGKLGFMQDLLHGVGKVVRGAKADGSEASAAASPTASVAPGVESLHKRMTLFLEDSRWQEADEYADRILDIDPEFAPAYMGKLLACLCISREKDLPWKANHSFAKNAEYQKAVRFADAELRDLYEGYQKSCNTRLMKEQQRLNDEVRKLDGQLDPLSKELRSLRAQDRSLSHQLYELESGEIGLRGVEKPKVWATIGSYVVGSIVIGIVAIIVLMIVLKSFGLDDETTMSIVDLILPAGAIGFIICIVYCIYSSSRYSDAQERLKHIDNRREQLQSQRAGLENLIKKKEAEIAGLKYKQTDAARKRSDLLLD